MAGISFAAPSARPGTSTFRPVKPGIPKVPRGVPSMSLTFPQTPSPRLRTSVPRAPKGGFPAAQQQTPGAQPAAQAAAPPPVSPLDSTYYENLAANQFKVGGQINALNAQSGNLRTALQSALGQLAYQQPRDQLGLEQGANRRGALYSSAYDQSLGNLGNTYQTRQSGLIGTNAQRQAAIASQIQGLEGGEGLFGAQQYDAAVARAVRAAAANPATGQAPAVPTTRPAARVLAPAPRKAAPAPIGKPTPERRSSRQQLAKAIAGKKGRR